MAVYGVPYPHKYQMTNSLVPNAEEQFVDENGVPYAGGQVLMCVPGTLNLKATYQDPAGNIVNVNPVVLDSAGRAIILGKGDYRQILYDSAGNEIWDRPTSAPLPGDAISDVMAPIVAATSLQQARDLLGVTQAISDAVSAIDLMPGPTGPQGVAGPVGPTGATGPTGPGGSGATFSSANPGYWFDPSTGFLINFGQTTTNSTGTAHIVFAKPYSNLISVTAVTSNNPINAVLRLVNPIGGGFDVFVEDTNNSIGVPCVAMWSAYGFA